MSSSGDYDFEPLVVIYFSSLAPAKTKEWVFQRLKAYDGAHLLAAHEPDDTGKHNMIVLGATTKRLLIGAQELQLKKPYKGGKGLREFMVADLENFENGENPDQILLKSEKQRIIFEEVQNLRPMSHEHFVPGIPEKKIDAENDTILGLLRSLDFVNSVFALHDKEELKLIEHDWFMSKGSFFKSQDIHKVRNYFGTSVAYYFAFLEFYTKALILPAILGIVVSLWPHSDFFKYSLFCFFNVIWWTVFMERWKRLSNKLAYEWGTLDMQIFEHPRSEYHGDLARSPITNKLERRYPSWKRNLKKYFVTYPIVMACLATALTIYFTYQRIQKATFKNYPLEGSGLLIKQKVFRFIPSAGYSLSIIPVNLLYRKLAKFLTDFENHRLQTAYENNTTSKLFIFFFVNCFVGLFYEAFFNINYANVKRLLVTLVIVNAVLIKFTEQIVPYIFKRVKKQQLQQRLSQEVRLNTVMKQAKTMTPFEGTYADYLTIFEQYGYVALFSAVFPWVTICALINNVFELRADAFKYCHVYQRPFAQLVSNIGSWHHAFEIMSTVAVVTNTALIAMQPTVREYFSSYSDMEYILIFVAAEHILIALKFAIMFAIPDVPLDVEIARARAVYESMEALRNERENKANTTTS